MAVTVDELVIADPPELWQELGFRVQDDACDIGGVRVRLDSRAGKRIASWSLRGIETEELDGLATTLSSSDARDGADPHPNAVVAIDHVVAFSPDLDRTVAVLEAAGLDLRRIREEPTPAGAPRQAFFRLADVILEVVQAPEDATARSGGPDGPAFFWGLAFKVADLDATVAAIGEERCSSPRDAVQPGRRIATLRRSAGLAVPVALMTE